MDPPNLPFLDDVVQELLDSWSQDNFLDRATAEEELRSIVAWMRDGRGEGSEPRLQSDRLLARRLSEVMLHGILVHFRKEGKAALAPDYMEALTALDSLSSGTLPQHATSFSTRLADPDGFELVVQLGHDLRSPLTSITFLAETLRSGHSGPLTDHQKAQLGLIYSASLGLGTIVADVVDLARAGGDPLEGEPQAFSLHAIMESVKSVVGPMAEAKGIEFRTKITTHDRVLGHPLAISRVLLNLVINGLKFTEHGWVEATAYPAGRDQVEFSVRDTGRGIPAESQARLFEPFRKSPARAGSFFSSSGLGLSIVRRLLLAMGTDLELETRPDWGTRFYFVLDAPAVTRF